MARSGSPFSVLAPRAARPALVVGLAALAAVGLGACSSGASGSSASGKNGGSCDGVAGTHHAELVVEIAPGNVLARCVGFSASTIKASDVLTKSKVELGTQQYSFGVAICQVDNVPAHYSQCLPSGQNYWALFVSHAGKKWTNPPTGVSDIALANGDLLGLRYDSPKGSPAPPPSPSQV